MDLERQVGRSPRATSRPGLPFGIPSVAAAGLEGRPAAGSAASPPRGPSAGPRVSSSESAGSRAAVAESLRRTGPSVASEGLLQAGSCSGGMEFPGPWGTSQTLRVSASYFVDPKYADSWFADSRYGRSRQNHQNATTVWNQPVNEIENPQTGTSRASALRSDLGRSGVPTSSSRDIFFCAPAGGMAYSTAHCKSSENAISSKNPFCQTPWSQYFFYVQGFCTGNAVASPQPQETENGRGATLVQL